MTDGNFTGIMVFDVNQPFYNTHSFRVATEAQVLSSYKNIHKYLTDLRKQDNLVAVNTLRHGEFREILASFLICLAHSEPSKHNSYNQTFPATLNDIDVVVSFSEIVKRLTVTPLQFLSAHADTVYALGKSRGIEFEFGKLHGLHVTGVGFISFPFANSDSKTDKTAFNKMLNENEHIRRYYFDGKLW